MPRKSITEIRSRFIAQMADAERRVELANHNAAAIEERAGRERDATIAGAHDVYRNAVDGANKELTLANAHLDGLKAALALFEDPKKAERATAKPREDREDAHFRAVN